MGEHKESRKTKNGEKLLARDSVLPVTKASEMHDGQDHDFTGSGDVQDGEVVTAEVIT